METKEMPQDSLDESQFYVFTTRWHLSQHEVLCRSILGHTCIHILEHIKNIFMYFA